jgi:hypothetical protein
MSYLLPSLSKKEDVDRAICDTLDKVLVLRFGRSSDIVCMKMDEIVNPGNHFYAMFLSLLCCLKKSYDVGISNREKCLRSLLVMMIWLKNKRKIVMLFL